MLGIVPFYVILGAHNLGIEPLQNHKNVYVSCMHVYLCYSVVSTIYVCMYMCLYYSIDTYVCISI
jgi:hypothetical protein